MILTENYTYLGRSEALNAKTGAKYYLLLYGKAVGDIPTGTYALGLKLRLASTWDSHFYDWATSGHAEADGKTVIDWAGKLIPDDPWQVNLTEGGVTYPRWTELQEGSIPVSVEFGVPKELTLTASWVLDYGAADWLPPFGVAAQVQLQATLPALLGATVPQTPGEGVLGERLTIRLIPLLEGVTHSLRYRFGGVSELIYEGDGQEITWTPSLELARQIPGSPTGTAVLSCTSYRDGSPLGTVQEVRVQLSLPETLNPTAVAVWEDLSGALDQLGICAKGVSRLQVTVTGTGCYGSTITSAAVTLNGKSYTGGVITDTGSSELVATVTDSRGRQGSKRYTLEVADYAAPTLTLDASRCDAGGSADDMGEYARITVTANTAAVGSNTAALHLTWGAGEEEIGLETGRDTCVRIVSAPSTDAIRLTATVRDALFSAPAEMVLSVGYATVDFLDGGKGIAFGTTATREGFECAMPARFTGGVSGVAPDGFGLGYSAVHYADLNDATKCGWWTIEADDLNRPFDYGMGMTINRYGGRVTQIAFNPFMAGDGEICVRSYDGTDWRPWEYLNPPMEPGVEYRTTERYLGVPVYTKVIDFGALPATASKQVAIADGAYVAPIGVTLVLSDGCVISGYGKDRNFSSAYGIYVDNTHYNVRVTTEGDFSALTGKVIVRYIKN